MYDNANYQQMLKKAQEMELSYRTKIIQLEREKEYQTNRANQYQAKFKDAVLQSQYSNDEKLLQTLTEKQNELNEARMQILQLNRKMANQTVHYQYAQIQNMVRQNEQLNENIEQIKNAAISAIMLKEEEIQELNKKISVYELMQNQLRDQYEKIQNLQRLHQQQMTEKEQDLKELNEKLSKQRDNFILKLESIQSEMYHEENIKEELQEKTQNLQGTLQENEMIIKNYEKRILEFQNLISRERVAHEQEKAKLAIEIETVKEEIKNYQKEEKYKTSTLQELKMKQKQQKDQIARLNDDIEELKRKLTIKKRKDNKPLQDKISKSFSQIGSKKSVFASFSLNREKVQEPEAQPLSKPNNLMEIAEIDEAQMMENFNLEHFEEIPEINSMDQINGKHIEKVNVETSPLNNPQIKDTRTAEIEALHQNLTKLQKQKKEIESRLEVSFNQIEAMNTQIKKITLDLQQERKVSSELRQQMKKTTKELQLTVEIQSMRQHVYKLENALLIEKLQNAERADYIKERYDEEKASWTKKLVLMTEKVASLEIQVKKKKKGFFG